MISFGLKDNNKIYILIFILIIFFFLNIYQLNNQHWSAMIDLDSIVVYNSLLVASGYEQEYRDHPAFILFLINGLIFNLISLFQDNYSTNIDIILNSTNIDNTFQFYFKIARITNYFINTVFIIFFYKILTNLKIEKNIIFLICLTFIFSQWYFLSFFALRAEIISLTMFAIGINFILSNKLSLLSKYFYSGIFFALAMFSKIQIIFLIAFPIFLIPFALLNKDALNFKISRRIENYLLVSIVLGILGFSIFQIYIQEFPRFERNKYLDLIFFAVSFLLILTYYLILNKFNYSYFKKNIFLLSSLLNGFVLCVILIIILDRFNILQVNDFIFLRITNPIHYMTEFTQTYAEGAVHTNFLFNNLLKLLTEYKYNIIELLMLLTVLSLAFKKNINKNKNLNIFLLVVFVIFIFNTMVLSFKESYYYHSYYMFCYLFTLGIFLNKIDIKVAKYFALLGLIIFSYNNFFNKKFTSYVADYREILNRENLILGVCEEFKTNKVPKSYANVEFFKYWHTRFDDNTIAKLCDI